MTLIIIGIVYIVIFIIFIFCFDRKQRNAKTYILLILAILKGSVIGIIVNNLYKIRITDDTIFMLLMIFYLIAGIIYGWWLYNKMIWSKRDMFNNNNDSFWIEFLFTLLIAISLILGMMVVLILTPVINHYKIYLLVFIYFIIPFMLFKGFDFYMQVPSRNFKVKWYFTKKMIREKDWPQDNMMWIEFEVNDRLNFKQVNKIISFRIEVPKVIDLGEIFRLGIRNYNHQGHDYSIMDLGFETLNEDKLWWLFKLKFILTRPHTWLPTIRYLDPTESALGNGLRPNDIIKAIRIL